MITLYDRETGEVTRREAVDAREILHNAPERYTTDENDAPKAKPALVDITKPSHDPRISDSGFPAGKEFTRRVTEDDQRLLMAAQHEGRSLPPDGGRVDAGAAIRAARAAEAKPVEAADGDDASTKAELKEALDARGIAYPANANKAELRALLDGSREA